jgi:hypothetical protein
MSTKLTLRTNDSYSWPMKCVVCEKETSVLSNVYGSSPSGLSAFGTRLSHRRQGLKIPLCQRHKTFSSSLHALYLISSVAMIFVGGIAIGSLASGSKLELWVLPALLISVITLITALNLLPVRIKNIGEHSFTIVLRNENYANEFCTTNDIKKP